MGQAHGVVSTLKVGDLSLLMNFKGQGMGKAVGSFLIWSTAVSKLVVSL